MAKGKLGAKIWREIEGPEGYAFIADDVISMTDDQARKELLKRLPYAKKVVEILIRLLKESKCEKNN